MKSKAAHVVLERGDRKDAAALFSLLNLAYAVEKRPDSAVAFKDGDRYDSVDQLLETFHEDIAPTETTSIQNALNVVSASPTTVVSTEYVLLHGTPQRDLNCGMPVNARVKTNNDGEKTITKAFWVVLRQAQTTSTCEDTQSKNKNEQIATLHTQSACSFSASSIATTSSASCACSSILACAYLDPMDARTVYLGPLAVSPTQQGRGLGSFFLSLLTDLCKSLGFHVLKISVINCRSDLFPFYSKRGFREVARHEMGPYLASVLKTHLKPGYEEGQIHFVSMEKTLL